MKLIKKRPEEKAVELREKLVRANELPLFCVVLAFQFISLLLLAFKAEKIDVFSIKAAVILPACSYLGYLIIIKRFHADRLLYILTVFLCGLGVILLRAVFAKGTGAEKQLTLLITVIPMLITGILIPRRFMGDEKILQAPAFILAGLFMFSSLILSTGSDAKSWIRIGSSFQLQPSELLKPVTLVILASGFSRTEPKKYLMCYILFAAAMCLMLVLQPDLGALFLYFILALSLFAVGTGHIKLSLLVLAGASLAAAALVIVNRQTGWLEYLTRRIDVFMNPWSDEYNTSRQIAQGLMSVASGGLLGSGLGLSSASRVAVVESDYIFAAAAEEFGTLFSLCLIAVYLIIMLKGISIALNARSRFHALIAFGAVFQLTTQAALIILGNLNVIPLTGVTLPFVSSGGSSLISCSLLIGLVMGVSSVNADDEYDDLMRISRGKWKEADS